VHATRAEWRARRTTSDKFVKNVDEGAYAYFDLRQDPKELDDRYDPAAPVVRELREGLEAYYAPPESGWLLQLVNGRNTDWSVTVRVRADSPLAAVRLRRGELMEVDNLHGDSRYFEGSVQLPTSAREDLLVVQTVDPRAELCVEFESNVPCDVVAPVGVSAPSRRHVLNLEPAESSWMAPTQTTAGETPIVAPRYVPPKHAGEEAPGLSQEAEEQLRGLGYG